MCMKNINIIPTFCDVISNNDDSTISLGNIGKRFRITTTNEGRLISQLSMSIFFSAMQSKNEQVLEQINSNETFDFRETYEIKIRLTETISGSFKDLDTFKLNALQNADSEHLCMSTFNCVRLCLYNNISLPEINNIERFVIKILIKKFDENKSDDENDKWIVQTIAPILFNN